MNRRFCLTLDLKDDPKLIAEYRRYHEKIWPEITRSIKDSGIEALEIYLFGARMFMIMEVNEHFSFEAKGRADQSNPKVQEWENLMWTFQQSLPQGETRGKMAADGENFRLGELTFFSYGVIQVSETNLSKLRLGTNSPRNGY
jgi:L-rhamnose mutarotase